jgi:chromosome segregation ATPase
VAPSECDALAEQDEEDGPKQGRTPAMLVGPLPNEVALQNLDSTASLAQSLASEDEEDDSKYGPVIDHVPSIRSSLPPSRGGSTVDALATVSEVIDDDDDDDDEDGSSAEGDNNGWADDDLGEIDLSERHQAEAIGSENLTSRGEAKDHSGDQNNHGDRGMTVRFRSVVAAIFESNEVPPSRPSFAGTGAQQSSGVGGRIFHDDEADIGAAWDDELDFDVSLHMGSDRMSANERTMGMSPERFAQFAEADTPPATPYSRTKPTHPETTGVALPDLSSPLTRSAPGCQSCAYANSVDCPCVQRILLRKEDGDDDAIKIDYMKLLQNEITKRLLLEEESKDLLLQLETLKNSKSAGEVRMDTVRALQEHVQLFESKLEEVGSTSDALRDQNQILQTALADAEATLSSLEEQRQQWSAQTAALRQETERTTRELNRSLSEAKKKQEMTERALKADLESKERLADGLSRQLRTLEEESSRLSSENLSLTADVKSFRDSLEGKQQQIANLLTNEAQFESEVTALKGMIVELETACASTQELETLYKEVESELVSQNSICDQLRNDVALLENRVQTGEGEQYRLKEELAGLSKQYENEMVGKDRQLATLEAELAELKRLEYQEGEDKMKLEKLQNEVENLSKENASLESKVLEVQSGAADLHTARSELSMKMEELHGANQQVTHLRERNLHLDAALQSLDSLSVKAQSLEEALKATCEERDTLKMALRESNELVTRMRRSIEDHGLKESSKEEMLNREIADLVTERSGLRSAIAAKCRDFEALEARSNSLSQEKAKLEHGMSQLNSSREQFQALAESTKQEATDVTEHLSKVLNEFESLQEEFAELEKEKEATDLDRDGWRQHSSELEESLNSALQDASVNADKLAGLNRLLSEKQRELSTLQDQQGSVATERDRLYAKCKDMEAMVSEKKRESHEVTRLMEDNQALHGQVMAVRQEFDKQSVVLQTFIVRAAALEDELTVERNASAAKDERIAFLQSTRRSLELSVEGATQLTGRIAELEAAVGRYEAERSDFCRRAESQANKEKEIQERCFALAQDRSQALTDREVLAQENDEMLVQFGVLNEQMDSYREQIHELRQHVQSYEQTSAIADARLLELQRSLVTAENALKKSCDNTANEPEETTKELFDLRNEQIKLIHEIEQLSALGAQKDDVILSLTRELDTVKSQLSGFEELKAESVVISIKKEELRSMVEDLDLQRNELGRTVESQRETIDGLMNKLSDVRTDASSFQSRVAILEEACAIREEALQQKEEEIRELAGRTYNSTGSSTETSDEILKLRTRLSQMETMNQETTCRWHTLTAEHETARGELASTSTQIVALETSVERLEREMAQADEYARQQSEHQEEQISNLTNALMDRKKELAETTKRNAAFAKEVDELRSQLDATRERALAAAVSSGGESTEIGILKDRVRSLEEQLETLIASSNAREESLGEEMSSLKRRIATKDGEALMLKNKVEALRGEVQGSRSQVEGKVSELQQLAAEIDNMRREQENIPETSQISALELLQRGKGNAENVENLRATVISLASALETSENLRADAIDRLLKERETYAVSLRHFSDSVKRFYHTLHFNEK